MRWLPRWGRTGSCRRRRAGFAQENTRLQEQNARLLERDAERDAELDRMRADLAVPRADAVRAVVGAVASGAVWP